jgi:hypothetical protein
MVHPTGFNQPYEVTVLARHAAYVGDLPLFPGVSEEKYGRKSAGCPYQSRQCRGAVIVGADKVESRDLSQD